MAPETRSRWRMSSRRFLNVEQAVSPACRPSLSPPASGAALLLLSLSRELSRAGSKAMPGWLVRDTRETRAFAAPLPWVEAVPSQDSEPAAAPEPGTCLERLWCDLDTSLLLALKLPGTHFQTARGLLKPVSFGMRCTGERRRFPAF